MAVISMKNRSTENRGLYEKFKKSDTSLVYADAKAIEDFSVELTIGNSWAEVIDKDNPDMFSFDGGKAFLKPNSSAVIEVAEDISIPYNMYGIIVPTGSSFLQKGIIIGAGKIEPSYSGKLKILLYNTSKSKRELIPGTKFASAIFIRTDRTISSQLPMSPGNANIKAKTRAEKIKSFILSDQKYYITEILLFLTLVATGLSLLLNASPVVQEVPNDQSIEVQQKEKRNDNHRRKPEGVSFSE